MILAFDKLDLLVRSGILILVPSYYTLYKILTYNDETKKRAHG